MKRIHWVLAPLAAAAIAAAFQTAQEPKPLPKAQDLGVEAPKQEPAKPVYTYQGKPLKVDFACKDEDIQNFGLTCSLDEVCEAFLELSGMDTVGNRMFLTGNIHTSNVTLWSILLSSEDAGKTWTEAYERMRSTGLEQIQFADFEIGWIGGQQLLALPRDPFFLLTNDGGKTWRRRPIYGESRVGAVEAFAFENRTNGALLIDHTQTGDSGGRHEYYETNTGGDTWSLRQVSPKPIAMKKPRTQNPDWRLRADAPSKSYRVEQRSGARWNTVVSFLVNVGVCKPAETTLAEPPPTEEAKPDEPPPPPSNGKAPPSLKRKKR